MFIKKFLLSAVLLLTAAAAAVAADKIKVLEMKVPESAAPGQVVNAHLTLQVLELDEPHRLRPYAVFFFPGTKIIKNVPGNNITPWKLEKFKIGDKLKVTAQFTIPSDIKAGSECCVYFKIVHKKNIKLIGSARKSFKIQPPQKMVLPPVKINDSPRPVAVVPILDDKAVIDGKLNESAWQKAAVLPVKLTSATGEKAESPAELRIFADKKNIYLGFRADKVKNDEILSVKHPMHDGPLWNNDSVEFFFTPEYDSTEYTQFTADLLDQHYDSLNGDFYGFNPIWQSKAQRAADSWVIEAAIPVDAISRKKLTTGTIWRGGFFRNSRRCKLNYAWIPTYGAHNGVKKHGLVVFGSLAEALKDAADFLPVERSSMTPAMQKIADQVKAVIQNSAGKNAGDFENALTEISELKKQFEKLQFAARFANSKNPLIVQECDPYAHGLIVAGAGETASGIDADFYPGEVRNIAFNITNISSKNMTVRATFLTAQMSDFKTKAGLNNFLMMGIKGYKTEFFEPADVATADDTVTSDALLPNPAGVWKLAPNETAQIYISVKAPQQPIRSQGVFSLYSTDNKDVERILLPVTFNTVASGALSRESKPIVFCWDSIMRNMEQAQPQYAVQHWEMLHKYGFTMAFINGLQHLPRPGANSNGEITGKMDFTFLREHIARIGNKFDYYYFDIGIWNKFYQRKDLFGLDFDHPNYGKAFKSWFKAVMDELMRLGIPNERLMVCPEDESINDHAVQISKWIKEVRPETRIVIDASSSDMEKIRRIDKYVDVWLPHMKTLQQEALQEFHKYLVDKGKPRFLYYYCTGGNEKIKKPHADYICNFYRVFERDFSGLGYWAAGQYYGDPWYRRIYARAYDTALLYPAESGPVPSRRLAAWNRGVQDLWLLRETEQRYRNDPETVFNLRKAAKAVADFPEESSRAAELRQYCRKLLEKRPVR